MAYSRSRKTLDSFYEYVKPLERGEGYMWVTEVGYESQVAYKIREALYLAKVFSTNFPDLAKVADSFVIEVVGPGKVQARFESGKATQARILGGDHSVAPTHMTGNVPLGKPVGTQGEQTVFTIIETWKKTQPSNTPLHFPQARLDYAQLTALWNWAQARTPRLMILVDDDAITLGPVDDDVEQFSWRPMPVEPAPQVEGGTEDL